MSGKLLKLGFFGSKAGTSLFYFQQDDMIIFLLVYVEDIIIVSSSDAAVEKLLSALRVDFALKDLGPLHYFLGIEVSRCFPGELVLTQRKYAQELIHKAGLKDCKLAPTPLPV